MGYCIWLEATVVAVMEAELKVVVVTAVAVAVGEVAGLVKGAATKVVGSVVELEAGARHGSIQCSCNQMCQGFHHS